MKTFRYIDFLGEKCPYFEHEEIEVCGVGKSRAPFICMDKYIDHSLDKEINDEINWGIAISDEHLQTANMFSSMPPEEKDRLKTTTWLDMIANIDEYDPTGRHVELLKEKLKDGNADKELRSAVTRYMYYAMGAIMPWSFSLHLITGNFVNKESKSIVRPASKNFPLLMEYMKTLPFKEIKRAVILGTFPNTTVPIHRDMAVIDHKDHGINLWFDSGYRPSFVWDPINKKKIYLEEGSRSYFFNNRDYHGVEAEPVFRYTLRIDGVFTDEMCEELGLEDGYTWKESYR